MGKLHLGMCFEQRHLISGVDVKLRLIHAKDTFCLVGDGQYKVKLKKDTFCLVDDGQYKVKLKNVAVFCRKVRLSDAVRLSHIKALQKSTAKYPLRRVEVKLFTLPRGNLSWTKESVCRSAAQETDCRFRGQRRVQRLFSEKNLQFQALQHQLPFVGEGRGTDLFKSIATGL